MKIHLIIAQRKERYAGEYAPEVLDAREEYDNAGEWIVEKLDGYRHPDRANSDFEAVEAMTIKVPTVAIMERLRPTGIITAQIVTSDKAITTHED